MKVEYQHFQLPQQVGEILERLSDPERQAVLETLGHMVRRGFEAGFQAARQVDAQWRKSEQKLRGGILEVLDRVDGHWSGDPKHADWLAIWQEVRKTIQTLSVLKQADHEIAAREKELEKNQQKPSGPTAAPRAEEEVPELKHFAAVEELPCPARLNEITLFVIDLPQGEAIMAYEKQGCLVPMVAADQSRLARLLPAAQTLSEKNGVPFRVLKFSQREDVTQEVCGT